MTDTPISKMDAAQRQLDCAVRLRLADEDSLAVHTLAYAAFGILRDLVRKRGHAMEDVLAVLHDKSSKMGRDLTEVPNFLKHAGTDPDGMLAAHSPNSAHLTLAFAIRLWVELGEEETPDMQDFAKLPDPYKPDHRASEFVKFVKGPLLSEQDEATWRATLRGITTTST